MTAAALVDWQGLAQVVLFAVIAGLVIVGAFSIGVVGLDRWSASRAGGRPAGEPTAADELAGPDGDAIVQAAAPVGVARPMVAFGSLAMAVAGFGICVVAVLLGLWSLINR
jgi:hypothetical protein